jgi:hypothetical protein
MAKIHDDFDNLKDHIKSTIGNNKDAAELLALVDKTRKLQLQKNNLNTNISNEKVIKKTFSIPIAELNNITIIKEKALNKRVVINDSAVIRIALLITSELREEDVIKFVARLQTTARGRPKTR